MIPASATNIDIQELVPSSNFLGLSTISIPLDSCFALHLEFRPRLKMFYSSGLSFKFL